MYVGVLFILDVTSKTDCGRGSYLNLFHWLTVNPLKAEFIIRREKMEKILYYSQEKINNAINALTKAGYTPKIKEFYHGNHIAIVVYTDKKDCTQEIEAIVSPVLEEEAYTELWEYHENYFCIGTYESLPGENPEHPIDVYDTIDFPSLQIYKIFTLWKDLTESHPDGGCCYFPDSILLKYEEKYYKIFPLDNHQGSLRRRYWYLIKPILEEIGCTDITYNEGNLD